MTDRELIDELERAAGDSAVKLTDRLVDWWTHRFLSRYVVDEAATWWWQSLNVEPLVVDYGTNDGLTLVQERAQTWGPCVLIVTDEQPEPAACFLGLVDDLCAVLRNTRNVEYVITDVAANRWIYDTHDNRLLIYDGGASDNAN